MNCQWKILNQLVYILLMQDFELPMKDFELPMKYECQWKISTLFANEMLSIANDKFLVPMKAS